MNYFVWNLNARIILRGKNYRCDKFLWKGTQKDSFMFWLRNWSYLIRSSSSSTLLHNILIFHSDASQSLFCLIICYIQQFHWRMILSNNSFRFGVDFFSTPKRKKESITRKRNYCVFSTFACTKLDIFLSTKKFLKWTLAFIVQKKKKKLSVCTNKFVSSKPS